jgi:hypothetical protein
MVTLTPLDYDLSHRASIGPLASGEWPFDPPTASRPGA